MADPAPLPDHHCPGCGAPQRAFLRYPWYFCPACRESACDGAGRRIETFNTGLGGGFGWCFANTPDERHDCRGVIALIHGRRVVLHEARFGGVVAEPLASVSVPEQRGVWRLDGPTPGKPPE